MSNIFRNVLFFNSDIHTQCDAIAFVHVLFNILAGEGLNISIQAGGLGFGRVQFIYIFKILY